MGHAKAILSLDDPQLRQQLSQVIITKQLTVREAEKESRRCLRHKTKEAPPTHLQETAIEECAEKLQQHFGTKVEIEQTKKGGKISLYYYSLEDLERVLSMCGVSV
jgi:ParB family chromosome partitioning protein